MTLSVSTRSGSFVADGLATPRNIAFRLIDNSDLIVTADGAVQTLNVHYQLTGAYPAQQMIPLSPFWANGVVVRYKRQTPARQLYDMVPGVPMQAETLEKELDRNAMAVLDMSGDLTEFSSRALMVPEGETVELLPPLADRKEQFLYFDDEGRPMGRPMAELPYVKGLPGDLTPLAQAYLDAVSRLLSTVAPLSLIAGGLPLYDPASEFSGGATGAIYKVEKAYLFQDAAGTVPVTASGQFVGCIRNTLGVVAWDFIQADNAKRPTYFEVAWGRAFVRCDNGKGMYSRANQSIKCPLFMAVSGSFSGTVGRGFFGFVKNTNARVQMLSASLSRLEVSADGTTDLVRPWKQAFSENFSARPGCSQVYHTQLSGTGLLDARFEDVTTGTYDIATAWLAGDEIVSCTLGLNCGSQSGGIGVVNADAAFDFFGGVVKQAAPANRAGVVSWLQAMTHPVPTAADKIIVVNGDSIWDNVGSDTGLAADEITQRLANRLAARFPDHCVLTRDWNSNGDTWMGYRRFSNATLTKRAYIINAARAGAQPGYFMGERKSRAFRWLPKADICITAHGHNIPVGDATIQAHPKRHLYRLGEFMQAQDQLRELFPTAQPVVVIPYPVGIAADARIEPIKATIESGLRPAFGDIVEIDLYTPWETAGRPLARYTGDLVHPSIPVGVDAMDAVIGPVFDTLPTTNARPFPPAITQRKLFNDADALLINGSFDSFSASAPVGVPVGWTAFGSATISRTAEVVSRGTSIKMVNIANGGIEQTINAVPLRGLDIALLVWMQVLNGSSNTAGRVQFLCDGHAIGDGRWNSDPNYRVWDAMVPNYHFFPVPATATTLTVRIYAASAAEAATIWLNRAILVPGLLPRDIV
jgi:hypothetical protein